MYRYLPLGVEKPLRLEKDRLTDKHTHKQNNSTAKPMKKDTSLYKGHLVLSRTNTLVYCISK